jgi:hypothetical protein
MYNKKLLKFDEENDQAKSLIDDFDSDFDQDFDGEGIKIVLPEGSQLVDDLEDDPFADPEDKQKKGPDITSSLARIADALERIADALER